MSPKATPSNTKRPVPYTPAPPLEPMHIHGEVEQEIREAENPSTPPAKRYYPPDRTEDFL